ncbi:MAG: diguanylate cyclase [Cellvibrionaceae bacterium]
MRLVLITLLTTMMISATAAAQQTGVVALDPDSADGFMLTAERMEYSATDLELGWDEIAVNALVQWSIPHADTVSAWTPDGAQWLRFRVRNTGQDAEEFRLEIRWPQLQRVEMRVFEDNSFGPLHRAGTDYPQANTKGISKNIVFPFSLGAEREAVVYVRVVDSYLAYLPIFLWSSDAHDHHADMRLVIFSVALGVLLIMTLFNAFLYLFTRDRMYLVYTNSVASSLLVVLAITGLGRLLVWGDQPWFADNAYPVFASYCFLSVTYFFRVFVDLKKHGGWVLKFNSAILLVWVAVLLGNLLGLQGLAMSIMGPVGVIGAAVGLISSVYLWRRGSRAAKYFSIAWAPICLVTFYGILSLFGFAGYFSSLEYLQSYSFVFEMVVLSVALADRINSEREAREKAQTLALQQQKAILHLKEKINTELEERVDIRTQELRSVLSKLAHANTELAALTKVDPLTKIHNRRHFDQIAEIEVLRASRSNQPLSMMLIDIDHFKYVNDTHGHVAGDQCLKLIAKAITEVVARETDHVARYGGEEFTVILPDTDLSNALLVAERVRRTIQNISLIYEGKSIRLTASIGCVSTDAMRGFGVDQLVNAADKAMYLAKQKGRNRVEGGSLSESKSSETRAQ